MRKSPKKQKAVDFGGGGAMTLGCCDEGQSEKANCRALKVNYQ